VSAQNAHVQDDCNLSNVKTRNAGSPVPLPKSAKGGYLGIVRLALGKSAVRFESSHLTIAMEAWKPASLKAMPPQSNIM
jgi:hypothetical protein